MSLRVAQKIKTAVIIPIRSATQSSRLQVLLKYLWVVSSAIPRIPRESIMAMIEGALPSFQKIASVRSVPPQYASACIVLSLPGIAGISATGIWVRVRIVAQYTIVSTMRGLCFFVKPTAILPLGFSGAVQLVYLLFLVFCVLRIFFLISLILRLCLCGFVCVVLIDTVFMDVFCVDVILII